MLKKNYFKILLSMSLILAVNFDTIAQKDPLCGTVTTQADIDNIKAMLPQFKKYEQEFLNLKKSNSNPIMTSIPVKAHIVRRTNGSDGLAESDLNDAITHMNTFYATAGMEFFLCDGINYIDNDAYYIFDNSGGSNAEANLTGANNVNGLINIYFVSSITTSSGGGAAGYAYYPGGPDVIMMTNSATTNQSTLVHEVGHFFNLIHTHGPDNSTLTTELVDGSNCDTDGDLICDTPADPNLSGLVDANCSYNGFQKDANNAFFTPDTSNILSYSRWSCRNTLTTQQYARIYAAFKTARNYFECPSFKVDIAADVTATCDPSLSVNFTDNSVGATSWQWDVDGDDVIDYTTQNVSHTYSTNGNYDVSLIISDGSNTISKKFTDFIAVGTENSLPVDENFDAITTISDIKWVTTKTGSFAWQVNSGNTPSNSTGPTTDSSGNGKYVYTEASGSDPGDVAELISYCIDINSNDAVLNFDYHMWGADLGMGELHIDIDDGTGWANDVGKELIGNQQSLQTDAYLTGQVDLSGYANKKIRIRFRAIRGGNFTSDIAIDNVNVTGTLSNNDEILDGIKIYPNPVEGDYLNIVNTTYYTSDDIKFQIRNILGQTISRGSLENDNINIGKLRPGAYMLILKLENSQIVKKFIKN